MYLPRYMIMTLFHNQFLFFSVDLMSLLLLCTIKPQNNEINLELSLPVWYLFNVLCLKRFYFLLGYCHLIDMKLILVTMNKMGRQGV